MTQGRITVDSGEIHYEVAGSGSPVVLLHGGMLSMAIWDNEFELLATRHRVVRYDARNHGQSTTAGGPWSNYDDLRLLLDGLDIGRATLVGHSLGARTSVDFALTWPDRIDRMVLAGPGVSGMTHQDPFILDQLDRLRTVTDPADAVEGVLRMWVDGPRRTPEQVDPALRQRCAAIMTDNLTRPGSGGPTPPIEVGAIDRLAELTMPITVLLGDLDSTDIGQVAERLVADAGAELIRLPDAGHVLNLEQPERFAEILRAFV